MQNWKKGCVFGHSDKFWKGHDGEIKKNACKNVYLGSIFIPKNTCLGYVLKVLLQGYPASNTSPPPRAVQSKISIFWQKGVL